MLTRRKTQIILALLVLSVFLLQNCLTIYKGPSQKIPVTSNPQGVKITVDGKEIGYAPLNLKLFWTKSYYIRIEKQGYNPCEIMIKRKGLYPYLALLIPENVILGILGGLVVASNNLLLAEFRLLHGQNLLQEILPEN